MLTLLVMTACQEERLVLDGQQPGDGKLRFQGVNAQQVVVETRAANRKGFFPVGTLYRIWAYGDENGGEERIYRFDACGKDTELGEDNQLIVMNMPEGEELAFKNSSTDVIDFYGLTDPEVEGNVTSDEYLKTPSTDNPVYTLKYREENLIPDLRYASKTENRPTTTSYIIPLEFKHILSKVEFEVVQQADETKEEEGKFKNIFLKSIKVLDRPSSGEFDIKKGQFTSYDKKTCKDFTLSPENGGLAIGITPQKVNSILLFPTAEADKEPMQVEITLQGTANAFNDFAGQDGYKVEDGGATMTVTCPVYDSYQVGEGGSSVPLRFLPNYRYVLQFMIMGNDVRIVTVVPRVYEWLDGETDQTDENGGYEEQDLGQPVTFGGVMWSDRNLGANSAHPLNSLDDWRKSIGYFYQFNRNIPYFPNTYENKKINLNTPLSTAFKEDASLGEPDFKGYRILYPVVNFEAWDFSYFRPGWKPMEAEQAIAPKSGMPHNCFVYTIGGKAKPTKDDEWPIGDNIIRFGINTSNNGSQGKYSTDIIFPREKNLWIKKDGSKGEQPCPQGWSVPTEEQFKSIMPTSGYSGNIAFRNYVDIKDEEDGGWDAGIEEGKKSLYKEHDFPKMFAIGGNGLNYNEKIGAGNPMKDKTGKEWAYLGSFPCLFREEMNDPQDGAKSQYVLSMYEDDWTRVQDESGNLNDTKGGKNKDYVYNWGVIYAIKNQGTPNAYRVKWEVKVGGTPKIIEDLSEAKKFCDDPQTTMYDNKTAKRYNNLYCYLVISRYPATVDDDLSPDESGSCEWVAKDKAWWSNPSEVLYLPIGGVAGYFRSGRLYNIGTEVRYALVDESDKLYKNKYEGAYKRCVWLKIAGSSTASLGLFFADSYTSDLITIRPVRD
ncbi:lipoprotein [gut metagenome]|uniref:Lipoprotein n=1 Tax=gut metagenome TaxID=749906 RepID=J9GVU8_9ZZZZ